MQLATELRRLTRRSKTGAYERVRDCYRLTVSPLDDMPTLLGFTLWEARPRGWQPILAGRVTEKDDVSITFCASPAPAAQLDALASLLGSDRTIPVTALPASDRMPFGASLSR